MEKETINERARKAPDTDLPKEENKEDWEEEKANQDSQDKEDPIFDNEESSEEEPVKETESQDDPKYLNDEDRFDFQKEERTEETKEVLKQTEKEGDECNGDPPSKKPISEMTEEEKK